LPLDQPVDYYKQLMATTFNNYPSFGNDDREKSYFLRMFLGCYRAADYLASRPDWDGRIMVVTGVSQGGYQSLVTAALHPKITAAIVGVPAGADSAGLSVGHPSAWPWHGPAQGANAAKIAETSLYFDTVNFAPRIKCPVMVALGLIDQTCPPRAVFSAYNQIHSPKEVVVMVNSAHSGKNHSQDQLWAHSKAWLDALKAGTPVPPPALASP
jgi:cephalosporin-C deacetylase-like acetyl esterase